MFFLEGKMGGKKVQSNETTHSPHFLTFRKMIGFFSNLETVFVFFSFG